MKSGAGGVLEIIVWGATGFTGRLVVEYLLERYGFDKTVRWAIAGRSQAKLDALKTEMGKPASGLSVMTADSHDPDTLQALVSRTRVIISTVGPYAKYGSTSKILGECGVCLALDELPVEGGFWTPASAMGDALLKRLPARAGLTFTVEKENP